MNSYDKYMEGHDRAADRLTAVNANSEPHALPDPWEDLLDRTFNDLMCYDAQHQRAFMDALRSKFEIYYDGLLGEISHSLEMARKNAETVLGLNSNSKF